VCVSCKYVTYGYAKMKVCVCVCVFCEYAGEDLYDVVIYLLCSGFTELDGHGQLLKLQVDGMDQAKFKCPRNLV